MNYLEQINRAIEHIEDRLDGEVRIENVARSAGLSRWHFQRIFKALTNETVKTYIRSRRLARSLDRLRTTDQRIIEIALAAGFDSQASYTRTFKRTFGLTPGAYRRINRQGLFVSKPRFDAAYLTHLHGHVSHAPTIRRRPEMTLVGLSTLFFGADSDKNNIAEELEPLWSQFLARVGKVAESSRRNNWTEVAVCYGAIERTSDESEQLSYCAGIEVASDVSEATLPEGMVKRVVPAATYATFEHRGHVSMMDNTVNYIYASWLLQSGWRHTYGPDLEVYGPQYDPTSESSVVEYAIPIDESSG